MMLPDDQIRTLDGAADAAIEAAYKAARKARADDGGAGWAMIAVACELRSLRVMLRNELREAAWRVADVARVSGVPVGIVKDEPIASRKAPA